MDNLEKEVQYKLFLEEMLLLKLIKHFFFLSCFYSHYLMLMRTSPLRNMKRRMLSWVTS